MRAILCLMALLGLVMAPLASAGAAPANHVTVIKIPLGSLLRKNLTIMKGTILQFEGDISQDLDVCTFTLQSGGTALAQGQFEKHWKLTWNTSEEPPSNKVVRVLISRAGRAATVMANIYIEILDKSPFDVKVTIPEKAHDPLSVAITSSGSLLADRFTFKLDGVPVTAESEKGTSRISLEKQLSGKHALMVIAKIGDSELELNPVDVVFPTRITVLPFDRETLPGESMVSVRLKAENELKVRSVELFVDGKSAASANAAALGSLTLNTGDFKVGEHTVYADVLGEDNEHYVSALLPFKVGKPMPSDTAVVIKKNTASADSDNINPDADFPSNPDRWLDVFTAATADQQRSINVIETQLNKPYIGMKSLNDAITALAQEQKFCEAHKYSIAKKSLPKPLSAENARSLQAALDQMSKSYLSSLEAIRTLRSALRMLEHYDGTYTNAPEALQHQLKDLSLKAYLLLKNSAYVAHGPDTEITKFEANSQDWLNRAISNIALVQERLKGN
jgi:hypothetical protein